MKHKFLLRFSCLPVLCAAILFVGMGCTSNEKVSQTSQITSPDSASTVARPSVSTAPASADNSPVVSTVWTYENRVEAAGEPVTHRASLTSPTRLQFSFPYTGGSTARLGLRERDGNALVSLHVANGAFNKSFQGGTVQMRFDDGPSVTYRYSAAENGSATVIFLDQPDAVIRRLKASRKLVVTVDFYTQGTRQFVFQTADLRWPY